MNERLYKWIYVLMATAIFVLILIKVFQVPITHDETATTVHYVHYNAWEIMMFPDNWPNNHILNTLLVKYSIALFGAHSWSVRLPNLLSFLLFAWAVYRIACLLNPRSFWLPVTAVLFFANPYLLDFFGLSRGYGLSVALEMTAISFLLSGICHQKILHLFLAAVISCFSAYASFTLLPWWASMFLLLLLAIWKLDTKRKWQNSLWLAALGLGFLALIATPLYKMQSTDQYVYWTSNGFFSDTLMSLVINWRYSAVLFVNPNNNLITIIWLIVLSAASVLLIIRQRRSTGTTDTLYGWIMAVVWLPVLINLIQMMLLHTPNLNGRTALFLYPLASLLLATALPLIWRAKQVQLQYVTAGMVVLLGIFHLSDTMKLNQVREWWYDADNLKVLNLINPENNLKEQVSLKTNWLFHPSIDFYVKTSYADWLILYPYTKETDTACTASYYYALESEYPNLQDNYEVVQKMSWDRWLLKHR
ncbi:MAG: hypothetical protein H6548_11945 [Chitinophagales bacterium]|nr:hypothetical protein [Chitinophagales bacterium]HPE97535.1 hypothetical protein [Chitinophagales bacterium]